MSDTSISNVMAIRAEVIARSRALREAQPTAPPGVTPTAPASNFADTLNAVVAKVNETQEQEDVVTEAYERGETTDIATVALIHYFRGDPASPEQAAVRLSGHHEHADRMTIAKRFRA